MAAPADEKSSKIATPTDEKSSIIDHVIANLPTTINIEALSYREIQKELKSCKLNGQGSRLQLTKRLRQ